MRPRTGGVASLLVVLVIMAEACASGPPPAAHVKSRSVARIDWVDCGAGLECATLSVPLDYSNPGARHISIALIRKRATQPLARIGSVLLNPGGPGGSGIEFLRGSLPLLKNLNTRFDLVAWDPRGVGQSTPV